MEPINRYLDAAILKPELSQAEVKLAIENCIQWQTKTVCVRPCDISLAIKMTTGTQTGVSTVLSFPHGSTTTAVKLLEAKEYCLLGVDEIDMVANYGMIISDEWEYVEKEVCAVAKVCADYKVPLKVIFETCYLSTEQIQKMTEVSILAKAAFVKTSTGFATGGATQEAVQIMIETAQERIFVKPSGGIRTRETALQFIRMGAKRLGTNYTANEQLIKENAEEKKENLKSNDY